MRTTSNDQAWHATVIAAVEDARSALSPSGDGSIMDSCHSPTTLRTGLTGMWRPMPWVGPSGCFREADFLGVKQVFWTDNHLGDGLHDALLALVSAGVLDRREEPDEQFRWCDR
jgi:hypothetical protein